MKHDVGAPPSASFGGWDTRMLATPGLKFDLYNAQPCPEACDAFMAEATYISSLPAATSVSRLGRCKVAGAFREWESKGNRNRPWCRQHRSPPSENRGG